ncbi:MAG: T9SS type A sorting domain-containing protein [Bacteroidia bacterium]|nr:T9SS type A sorting domain-containing protein [Bacteroidia bacterium]
MVNSLVVFGQADSGVVNNKTLQALVQANGTLFSQKNDQAFSRFPTNSQKNMLAYSGSWMLGMVNDKIYANRNIDVSEPQVWPGPIDTVTRLPKDAIDWAKVWTINRSQVDEHKLRFKEAGYEVPDEIKQWPSSHDDDNVNAFLAPFIDWNKNGIYDPENGDYPSFLGDHAAYFIANDLYGENVFPEANKLGVELQGLVYAFDAASLTNTLFVKLFLINRSENDYEPFYFGQYVDYQLGNDSDNYTSTDVNRRLVYGYNGDSDDEGPLGYGNKLPAAGCVFLSQSLESSCAFQNGEEHRGYPETESEMLSVMEGKWRSGTSKYASGMGLSGASELETKFIYPKKTDANVQSENWGDEGSGDDPGVRNGLGVIKFDNFKAGKYKQIDLAFVLTQSEKDVEENLLTEVDAIHQYYRSTLSVSEVVNNLHLDVYPNPFVVGKDRWLNMNALEADLWDLNGKKVTRLVRHKTDDKKFEIPCNEKLVSGIYYIKAVTDIGILNRKVIVVSDR